MGGYKLVRLLVDNHMLFPQIETGRSTSKSRPSFRRLIMPPCMPRVGHAKEECPVVWCSIRCDCRLFGGLEAEPLLPCVPRRSLGTRRPPSSLVPGLRSGTHCHRGSASRSNSPLRTHRSSHPAPSNSEHCNNASEQVRPRIRVSKDCCESTLSSAT